MLTTDPTLQENLAFLALQNPALAEVLLNSPPTASVQLVLENPQALNLTWQGQFLHDVEDPLGEARQLLEQVLPSSSPHSHTHTIFLFGLGLGYLLRRAFVSSQAQIIVYEPSREILRSTLEVIDIREELASGRVILVSSLTEIPKALERVYRPGNPFHLIPLPGYKAANPQAYKEVLTTVKEALESWGNHFQICQDFHVLSYAKVSHPASGNTPQWFGVDIFKMPSDLWMYQEIIAQVQPDLIIETGTALGGSTLYLASLCDLMGKGQVISIDIEDPGNRPVHPRITYRLGSSTSPEMVAQLKVTAQGCETVLVILDSDHTETHLYAEMQIYQDFVTPGSYMIVEDSNINGHPVKPDFGPGPMEAIHRFLQKNPPFVIDRRCERFLTTQNPNGYLKKLY